MWYDEGVSRGFQFFLNVHEIMGKGVGIQEDEHYVVGPWLTFDPKAERHTGAHADAANVLLKDRNREGFEIPSVAQV